MASTNILAVLVSATLGTVMDWEPSFGVFDAKVVGKVSPPSVENLIFTF